MSLKEEITATAEAEVTALVTEKKVAAIDALIATYGQQAEQLQAKLTEAQSFREELVPIVHVPVEEVSVETPAES